MDWQRDDIRQVPDPNRINKQQVPHRQEVPSPQQIPGSEVFLERPDVPAKPHMPTTQPSSTEWIHTRLQSQSDLIDSRTLLYWWLLSMQNT